MLVKESTCRIIMDVLLADSFAGMRGVIIEKINQNNKFTDAYRFDDHDGRMRQQ